MPTPDSVTQRGMYQSLQAGRAAAAALVVLFHLCAMVAQTKYFGFDGLWMFGWGDAGVEFFFVLSGFLITITNRRDFGNPAALPGYLLKRLLRIYPTYWLVCAAVCIAALLVVPLRSALPDEFWVYVKALLLIPQDPAVVGGTGSPILFVAWSLGYEMLFYAVIALAVLHRAAGAAASLGLLAVHVGCRFGSACGYPASFLDNNLIFVFSFGVAAAYLVRSRFRLPMPVQFGLLAMACFVVFGLYEVRLAHESLPVDRRLVYGALGAVIVLAFAQAEDRGRLKLTQRWITLLGDSSYALYLLHIPIMSVSLKLLAKTGASTPPVIVGFFFLVFGTCVGLSLLFHLTVERYLLRATAGLARRTFNIPARRREAASAVGSTSAVPR